MEVKLKYRIDKLLKQVDVAGSKAASEHDALSFKPNVANLAATAAADADDDDAENDEDDEDEFSINPMDPAGRSKAGAATAIYRPPRISATPYQDGATTSRRAAKLAATASRSRLLRELEDELGDAPESRSATLTDASARTEEIDAHFAERARYEEDNFLRVNYTKQDKKLRKQRDRVANMGDEMRGLMADFEDEEAKPAKPRGPPGAKKRVRNDDAAESGRNHVDEMLGFLENKRAKRKKTALYDGGGNDDGPLTDGSGALSAEFQKARKSAGKKLRGEANKDMRRAQRAQFE
ncbi:hypothetical protein BC828DRAFT_390124 [Blastocladiella britannica]|nr:hypothetical protein BC828DRAFT_390124 [Blastocladiella britannica]